MGAQGAETNRQRAFLSCQVSHPKSPGGNRSLLDHPALP